MGYRPATEEEVHMNHDDAIRLFAKTLKVESRCGAVV